MTTVILAIDMNDELTSLGAWHVDPRTPENLANKTITWCDPRVTHRIPTPAEWAERHGAAATK